MSNLESVIDEVSKFGRIWLHMGSDLKSWTSSVEVSMSIVGAKFEVRSDSCKTPLECMTQLRKRLMDALVSFDGKAFKVGA